MDKNYFAVFSQEGNLPSFKQSQNINSSGLQTESPHKRIILIDRLSCPWALLMSRFKNLMLFNLSFMQKLAWSGSWLLLSISLYCLAKESLNTLAFSVKLIMDLSPI